jgi:hypothetical protein
MEYDHRNTNRTNEYVAQNNNGVTNFLRHFAHRSNNKDGLQQHHHQQLQQQSNMKKSNRILRSLGRNKHISTTNDVTMMKSSVHVTEFPRSNTVLGTTRNKAVVYRGTEEVITFDSSSEVTRLGICPTCYDVPETSDEEVYFINNNVAAASGIIGDTPTSTSSSLSSIPNLFSTLPIWEESCTQEELQQQYREYNYGGSPQKSVGSCDSVKSDSSIEEKESISNEAVLSTSSIPSNRNKKAGIRYHNNSSSNSVSSISSSLISKAKSIVQRARDKDNHHSSSDNNSLISTSSSLRSLPKTSNKSSNLIDTTNSKIDTVKIFLLLVEPKSKVFELIQLLYPRKNTKVIDLIKMIPQNATELVLASQSYVGITRPKRRADPITDLNMLASNSMYNTTHQPTASIESGEIIVVIPALSSTKEIVVLSKQILSSSHIQKLISISKGRSSSTSNGIGTDKLKRKVIKKQKNDYSNLPSTISKKSSSPKKVSTFNPMSSQQQSMKDTRSPKVVSFLDENCTEELKRAMENANVANEEAGCSPCHTPTSFLSESVPTGLDTLLNNQHEAAVEFPRDMLDAYLSKDAVLKICSTPNSIHHHLHNTIPNIECTSSSSMVDDNDETTTIDVEISSCDGSMTSSYNSWAQSVDSTSVPSLRKNGFGTTMHDLESRSTTNNQQNRPKKKRLLTKKMKRITLVSLFVVSIVRYHLDPNGIQIHQHQNVRSTMLFQPLGWIGFIYLLFMFAMLVKVQKYYDPTKALSYHVQRRCFPTLRLISKLYNKFSFRDNSEQKPLVPTRVFMPLKLSKVET